MLELQQPHMAAALQQNIWRVFGAPSSSGSEAELLYGDEERPSGLAQVGSRQLRQRAQGVHMQQDGKLQCRRGSTLDVSSDA